MDNKKRWQQRFDNFDNAYQTFCRIFQVYRQDKNVEVNKMALVQGFEFTIELAWKTLKDYLEDVGYKNLETPKETIRQAFQAGLIDNAEDWMAALQKRNLTSHTYHRSLLQESVNFIDHKFHAMISKLYEQLKAKA